MGRYTRRVRYSGVFFDGDDRRELPEHGKFRHQLCSPLVRSSLVLSVAVHFFRGRPGTIVMDTMMPEIWRVNHYSSIFYARSHDDGSNLWLDDETFAWGEDILRDAVSPMVSEWPELRVKVDWANKTEVEEYYQAKYQGHFSVK